MVKPRKLTFGNHAIILHNPGIISHRSYHFTRHPLSMSMSMLLFEFRMIFSSDRDKKKRRPYHEQVCDHRRPINFTQLPLTKKAEQAFYTFSLHGRGIWMKHMPMMVYSSVLHGVVPFSPIHIHICIDHVPFFSCRLSRGHRTVTSSLAVFSS